MQAEATDEQYRRRRRRFASLHRWRRKLHVVTQWRTLWLTAQLYSTTVIVVCRVSCVVATTKKHIYTTRRWLSDHGVVTC